jgi:hypothetical protein
LWSIIVKPEYGERGAFAQSLKKGWICQAQAAAKKT